MGQPVQTGRRFVERGRPNRRTDQGGQTDHADAHQRHVAAVAVARPWFGPGQTATGDVHAKQSERRWYARRKERGATERGSSNR